jgi:lysophospholipase L1-like esterase
MLGLGDSIAAGIGAPQIADSCMALLARRLAVRHPGLRLVNLAIAGETSGSMIALGGQLERAERIIGEIGRRGGDVAPITLSIGGNDAIQAAAVGVDAAPSLARNLNAILNRLDAALGAVGSQLAGRACLQTIYNPFEVARDDTSPQRVIDTDTRAPPPSTRVGYNHVIRDAAGQWHIELADVARIFRGRAQELTWVLSGDIHPSERGHTVIADAYVAACGWDGV